MIPAIPITSANFASFGEVIETSGHPHKLINEGLCQRFTDLASFDIDDGTVGLSLFQSELRETPYTCTLLERHPKGSQCFIPMGGSAYLVITADDESGKPSADIHAFLAAPHQCVNIAKNTWHGVLAPISGTGLFAVIDRIGTAGDTDPNLEEHLLETPVKVHPPT